MTVPIAIATEDELSEAVALRLVAELSHAHRVTHCLRKGGFGYLRSKMGNWCQMARQQVMVVLTDLDQMDCAVALRSQWLANLQVPDTLLLRVAVREAEAWALSDHEAIRKLVGHKGVLSRMPENLPDPKQVLLRLAKSAPREIKADLLREANGQLRQGLGYNARLVAWVRSEWDPERAAAKSPSLARARIRLREVVSSSVFS